MARSLRTEWFQPRRSGHLGTATIRVESDHRHAERIRVVVVDAFETSQSMTDQLSLEGYDVTACPGPRAASLITELEEKGADLVQIHVRSSPHSALEMLRAAVTVCRLRSHSQPVGILTAAATTSRPAIATI